MEDIRLPKGVGDTEGAQRVFEGFLILYQPTMSTVEEYLHHMVMDTEPVYAEAYRPWLEAVKEMMQGVYLLAKKIPLPDSESFIATLKMFSFEGAIDLIRDICLSRRFPLPEDWADKFRKHIDMLLFSVSIMNREQQASLSY